VRHDASHIYVPSSLPSSSSSSLFSLPGRPPPTRRPPVAQRVLNAVLQSPLYEMVLVPQARATMVKTAEANGVPWAAALAWIQKTGGWSDATLETWAPLDYDYPDYCKPVSQQPA
jgi:hypothetical protein